MKKKTRVARGHTYVKKHKTTQTKTKKKTRQGRLDLSALSCLSLLPFPTGFLPARAQQHGEHISPVVLDGRRRPLAAYSGRFVSSDSTAMVRRLGAT
jgi:hypothetical protein